LEQFFELIAVAGATGVLIEWEDTFPYEGLAEEAAAQDAYTKEEVREDYWFTTTIINPIQSHIFE